MKRSRIAGLVLSSIAALGMTCATTYTIVEAAPAGSNKWRIEISEGANAPGTITFRVTPDQGTPVEVTAQIKGGRGENGVARDIRDALAAQLSSGRFDVEVDDGEDVLIKKREGQPDFAVELVQSSITGTRVEVDSE